MMRSLALLEVHQSINQSIIDGLYFKRLAHDSKELTDNPVEVT